MTLTLIVDLSAVLLFVEIWAALGLVFHTLMFWLSVWFTPETPGRSSWKDWYFLRPWTILIWAIAWPLGVFMMIRAILEKRKYSRIARERKINLE